MVTNELICVDLLNVKRALAAKPKKHKRKLVGIEVFLLTNLKKMKEEKDKAQVKRKSWKKRSSTSAPITALSQTLYSSNSAEEEESNTIVVAVWIL